MVQRETGISGKIPFWRFSLKEKNKNLRCPIIEYFPMECLHLTTWARKNWLTSPNNLQTITILLTILISLIKFLLYFTLYFYVDNPKKGLNVLNTKLFLKTFSRHIIFIRNPLII